LVANIEPNSVYISCFHEFKTSSAIKKLAETLHQYNFKVHYEPFCKGEIRNLGGITEWKEHCIRTCQDIIIVCSSGYFKEDLKHTTRSSKPSKIAVDSRLLRVLAYGSTSEKRRLVTVLLDSSSKKFTDCVPLFLQPSQQYSWPSNKEDLLFCLKRVQKYVLPEPNPKDLIVIKPKVIPFPSKKPRKIQT